MKNGFTIVEIMIVMTIIMIASAICIPNFFKSRDESNQKCCITHLKMIEEAKSIWEVETRAKQGSEINVEQVMKLIYRPNEITNCPSGGIYTWGVIGTNVTCSIKNPQHKI